MGFHCRWKRVVALFVVWALLSVCAVGSAQVLVPSGWTAPPDVVRSPGNDPGFLGGIEVLWLRPTSSKLLYGVVDPARAGPDSILGTLMGIRHGRDLGFRLSFASGMRGEGSGLEAAYTYFWGKQDNEAQRGTSDFWGLLLHANSIIDDNDVTDIQAQNSFRLHEGVFASRVSFGFGSRGDISLSGGVQFTRLRQELEIYYRQRVTATLFRGVRAVRENVFTGLGPRFAVETRWSMSGATLYSQIGAAMLVGPLNAHVAQHDWQVAAVNGTERVNVEMPLGTRIVPAVDMRLGASYDTLSDWGFFRFSGGWEVRNYFSAISTYEFYDDVDSQLGAIDQSDLGLDGFFVSVRGEWAFRL